MHRRLALAAALLLVPAAARAAGGTSNIPCGAVEPGVIAIDGLLEDWRDVPAVEAGSGDDFAMSVKCNYDRDSLFLVVDVRDDTLARMKGKPGTNAPEDHIAVVFADGARLERLIVYPGDANRDVPRVALWSSSGAAPKEVDIADALQARGWAVELRVPLRLVPGWSPGIPSIRLAVAAYDADARNAAAIEKTLTTSPIGAADKLGTTEFADAGAVLDAFLRDRKLAARDVTFDRVARVLPAGRARVVVAGRTLGILTDEFLYMELPVLTPKDILDVRLANLTGDGQESVLIRYRESSARGTREVLAAFRATGDGLRRAFGVEVARTAGMNRLQCRVSFVPRGNATDIVIEPLPAVGWTEMSYREPQPEDLVPILLPWSGEKRARFQFRGDEYMRAE